MKTTRNVGIQRLRGFAASLKKGEVISSHFNCRRVKLNLEPTPYNPELVRETRKILGASQAMFAKFLGASVQSVRNWEQGRDVPKDVACRFMDEIRRNPNYWLERFCGELISK